MMSRSERGFSLVEVIVANFLLIIGIAIIASIIAMISEKNFFSQRHTQAVILAQNKIDELLNEGYSSSELNPGVNYENSLNPVNATGDSSGVFYQFWDIYDVDPIERSKKIVSTIQWEAMDGETKTVTLTAICIDESN